VKPKRHEYYWEGVIEDGTGRQRVYRSEIGIWHQINNYTPVYQAQIREDKLPNGNIIKYTYKDFNESAHRKGPRYKDLRTYYILSKIEAFSSSGILLGYIDLNYIDSQQQYQSKRFVGQLEISGSEGRKAVYTHEIREIQERHVGRGEHQILDVVLKQVDAAWKPSQTYQYRLDRKSVEDYFKSPYITNVYSGSSALNTTYDLNTGKVTAQSAPVGINGEMCPVARYEYYPNHTAVFDGENHKTIFRFNQEKRITDIEKYQGNALYCVEQNEWNPDTGNLTKNVLNDAHGKVFRSAEYKYDSNQNPIEEKINGHTIYRKFSDDGFNLLREEADRKGRTTKYTYVPGTNLVTSEIVYEQGTPVKRSFHFYDSSLNSVRVKTIIDDGHSNNPDDLTGVTLRKIVEISPKRKLPCIGLPEEVREKTLDASGHEVLLKKVRYAYHPSGEITREDHYDGNNTHRYSILNEYDDRERLVATIDPLGHRTTFEYNDNFNLIAKRDPLTETEWTYDKANRPTHVKEGELTTQKIYDKASRVIATIDPCGNKTRYTYDSLGRVIAIYHPDGGVEHKEYDVLGNVAKEIDPNGWETRKEYNFRGQPIAIYHPDGSEEHFTYNLDSGTVATHVDRNGTKTAYTYDVFDNCTKSESPHKVITATYSPFHKLSETDAEGLTTTYEYDFAGRKIAEKNADRLILYSYDELGRLYRTQIGETVYVKEYDLLDRVIEKRTEDLNGNIYFQEKYVYDANGNKTHLITCMGVTETKFNARNQPIQILTPDGYCTTIDYTYNTQFTKTTTTPKGIQIVELHDVRNRLKEHKVLNPNREIIQHREFEYDPAGNRTKVHEHIYEGTTPLRTITNTWEYGPSGRVQRLIESDLKETNYLYDSSGRLHTIIKPDKTELIHSYDPLGRLSTLKSSRGDIAYAYRYDKNDRVIEVNSLEGTTKRAYDIYGHLIQETLANGLSLTSFYNPQGERTQVGQATFVYRGGMLSQATYQGHAYIYTRNLAGKIIQASTPIGTFQYSYDTSLRRNGITTPYYTSSGYTFDPCGNLLSYTYTDPIGTVTNTYKYDHLNQLLSEDEHSYAYDSLYNRVQKDEHRHTLNTLSQTLSDGEITYDYDPNGNLIRAGDTHFAYDSLDRLVTVQKEGNTYSYTYDPFNRRISKDSIHYLWDGKNEIGSTNGELRILGEGLGAEIGAAAFIVLDNRVYVPIHDHRGNLVSLGAEI